VEFVLGGFMQSRLGCQKVMENIAQEHVLIWEERMEK
jgi:hypothetical protein